MDFGLALRVSTDSALPFLRSLLPSRASVADSIDTRELDGVRTECHHAWPADPRLLAGWDALLARVPDATVFHTHHWQRAVLDWTSRIGRLRLLAVWRGSRLIGILPVQVLSFGRLLTAGWVMSDYLDPLVDPLEQETFWRHLLEFLRSGPSVCRRLHLQHVRPGSACIPVLQKLAADEGFSLERREKGRTMAIDLPADWDSYLEMLSTHDRKELRRKLNKAELRGEARLVPCQSDCDAEAAVGRIFDFIEANGGERWMKSRWLYRGVFEGIGRDLIRANWLRPYLLSLGGKPAAGLLTFRSQGGMMAWSTGFDPSYRSWSPGIVTFSMVIRDAIRQGVKTLDLLRGDFDYKARLGATSRPLYDLILRPCD